MRLAILVGLTLLIVVSPSPGQEAATASHSSTKVHELRNGDKQRTTQSMTIAVPIQTDTADKNGRGVSGSDPEYRVKVTGVPPIAVADKNKGFIDYLYDWGPWVFAFLLVVVGFIQASVMRRQKMVMADTLTKIAEQAIIMKAQADVMQAQFDQWVQITNWTTGKPREHNLNVSAELVNQTNYPMTVSGGFAVDNSETPQAQYTYAVDDLFLAPNTPITMTATVMITPDQQASGCLSVFISGRFSHTHQINKRESVQTFEGQLECWNLNFKRGCHFTWLRSMNPTRDIEQESRRDRGQQEA